MKEIGVKDDLKDFWLEHLDGWSHEGKSADGARAGAGRQVGKVGAQFWTCLLGIQMELSCRWQMCDLEMRTGGA